MAKYTAYPDKDFSCPICETGFNANFYKPALYGGYNFTQFVNLSKVQEIQLPCGDTVEKTKIVDNKKILNINKPKESTKGTNPWRKVNFISVPTASVTTTVTSSGGFYYIQEEGRPR